MVHPLYSTWSRLNSVNSEWHFLVAFGIPIMDLFYRCKVDMFFNGVITHSSFHDKKGGPEWFWDPKGVLFVCLFLPGRRYKCLWTVPKVLACLGYQLEYVETYLYFVNISRAAYNLHTQFKDQMFADLCPDSSRSTCYKCNPTSPSCGSHDWMPVKTSLNLRIKTVTDACRCGH